MEMSIGNVIQIVTTTGVVASVFWMGKYKLNGMGDRTRRIEECLQRMEQEQTAQGNRITSLETSVMDLKEL